MKKLGNALKNYYLSKKLKIVRIVVYGVFVALFVVFMVMAITPTSFCKWDDPFSSIPLVIYALDKKGKCEYSNGSYKCHESLYIDKEMYLTFDFVYKTGDSKGFYFHAQNTVDPKISVGFSYLVGDKKPILYVDIDGSHLNAEINKSNYLDDEGRYYIYNSTGNKELDSTLISIAENCVDIFYSYNDISGKFSDCLNYCIDYADKINGTKATGIAITCVAGILLAVNTFLTIFIGKRKTTVEEGQEKLTPEEEEMLAQVLKEREETNKQGK